MEILAHKSALNSSIISKEKQTKKVLIKVHKIVPKKEKQTKKVLIKVHKKVPKKVHRNMWPKMVLQIVLILVMTF